ncbi:Protein CBG01443 [Caenorhabditis briggsae]|uniref:Protein CBG01443 n=2 Tax=Caenorhabditis briggsae TaxID=6238 RepID=A8WQF6_CAEBR|nr:Protein CBG01443 [Caenorhabditis briggsae]ULT87186.1 hypothetical protein L3Y34_006757 [Caenorhabditis briggsae]CAP22714.1 Protein CBG01443 [Caenorhabditis briggsae]
MSQIKLRESQKSQYTREFDDLFQRLLNEYLHGEFRQATDHSDFEAFHRMYKELNKKRDELEDNFFPEQISGRREITEEEEEQSARECYDKIHDLRRSKGFNWMRTLLEFFGKGEKFEKLELFKY